MLTCSKTRCPLVTWRSRSKNFLSTQLNFTNLNGYKKSIPLLPLYSFFFPSFINFIRNSLLALSQKHTHPHKHITSLTLSFSLIHTQTHTHTLSLSLSDFSSFYSALLSLGAFTLKMLLGLGLAGLGVGIFFAPFATLAITVFRTPLGITATTWCFISTAVGLFLYYI